MLTAFITSDVILGGIVVALIVHQHKLVTGDRVRIGPAPKPKQPAPPVSALGGPSHGEASGNA